MCTIPHLSSNLTRRRRSTTQVYEFPDAYCKMLRARKIPNHPQRLAFTYAVPASTRQWGIPTSWPTTVRSRNARHAPFKTDDVPRVRTNRYAKLMPRATASSSVQLISDTTVSTPSNLPQDISRIIEVRLKAENLGGRKRRLSGSIDIPRSTSRVWKLLTSYEEMADYMPNIISSKLQTKAQAIAHGYSHGHENGIKYLDQVGIISRKLRLRSRMLLRVTEDFANSCIQFERVESRDFTYFVGKYLLNELDDSNIRLDYELEAIPFPLYPMSLVEHKVLKEVPRMLAGIRDEAVLGKYVPFVEDE